MVSLGLNLPSLQFALLKRRPALLIRVLLATCVAMPLAALLLLQSPLGDGLSPAIKTAVMLMAICPSAPMIALKSRQLADNPELATRLQFWSACAAIISVPIWISQLPSEAGETLWNIPILDVAFQIFTVQLIPLLVGVSLRRWRSEWAERWNSLVQKIATALLFALLVLILIVLVGIAFVLGGLEEARTLSSRLTASLTIIVLGLLGPGWISHQLRIYQRNHSH